MCFYSDAHLSFDCGMKEVADQLEIVYGNVFPVLIFDIRIDLQHREREWPAL